MSDNFGVGMILTIHRLPLVVFGVSNEGLMLGNFGVGRILTIHQPPLVVFGVGDEGPKQPLAGSP